MVNVEGEGNLVGCHWVIGLKTINCHQRCSTDVEGGTSYTVVESLDSYATSHMDLGVIPSLVERGTIRQIWKYNGLAKLLRIDLTSEHNKPRKMSWCMTSDNLPMQPK